MSASKYYQLKGFRDEKDGKWYLGMVRLFFINKYENHPELNIDFDASLIFKEIKTSFEHLQFKVLETIVNPKKDKFYDLLNEEKYSDVGCLFNFIFSRGDDREIYCADYDKKKYDGTIWRIRFFSSAKNRCPTINFIETVDENGWRWRHGMMEIFSDCPPAKDNLTYQVNNLEKNLSSKNSSSHIQEFCRLLNQHGRTKDLKMILDLMTEKIQDEISGPMLCSSLRKKLLLLPPDDKTLTQITDKFEHLKKFGSEQIESRYKDKFEHLRVLGGGQFGVVFKALDISTKIEYSVKRIQLRKNAESEIKRVVNDVTFLLTLSEEYFVTLFDVWHESVEFESQAKEDAQLNVNGLVRTGRVVDFCFIQMEYCSESLEQWLTNNIQREKIKSLNIFKQIVQGLEYLHDRNMIHRDIKPSNILFMNSGDLRVRISDYGLTKYGTCFFSTCALATSLYSAPEIVFNKYDTKSDIFSAGMILLELLHNCAEENHDKVLNSARENEFPQSFNNELKFALPTLKNMLSSDLKRRPTSADLLKILSTDPQWNEELKLTTSSTKQKSNLDQQKEWKFESTCTCEGHNVDKKEGCDEASDEINWKIKDGSSEWFELKNTSDKSIVWQVCFCHLMNDDFAVNVRFQSPEEKEQNEVDEVSFRLYAVEKQGYSWTEEASVLGIHEVRQCCFSKKFCELSQENTSVQVNVQWTQLNQLIDKTYLLENDETIFTGLWSLHDLKQINPTSQRFSLYSIPFGRSNAWRIVLDNQLKGNDRKYVVWIKLQHIPTFLRKEMKMMYELSVNGNKFEEKKSSWCAWNISEVVKLNFDKQLDLKVIIRISK